MLNEDIFTKEYENCGHVKQDIDKLEESPIDARTKEYEIYEEKLIYLYKKYNQLSGFKAYKC